MDARIGNRYVRRELMDMARFCTCDLYVPVTLGNTGTDNSLTQYEVIMFGETHNIQSCTVVGVAVNRLHADDVEKFYQRHIVMVVDAS